MNKRKAKQMLLKSREVMQQADYAKLTGEWDEYIAEVNRLKKLGMENAAVCGVSCPTCYREIPLSTPSKTQCRCGNKADIQDIYRAHGVPDGLPETIRDWIPC